MRKQPLAGFGLGLALVAAAVILVLRRRSAVRVARVVYEAPLEESPAEPSDTMDEVAYVRWVDEQWAQTGDWQDSSTLGPDPRDIGRGEWGGEEPTGNRLFDLGFINLPGQPEVELPPEDDWLEPFTLADLGLTDEEICALGLQDCLTAEERAAHEQPASRPAPTIARVNERAFAVKPVPPAKPILFRHIWWTPMWQQDVVIRHPRFYHWLKQWGADFGFEGPVGTLITQFSRYGWTSDDLIRYYLDELTVARKVKQPFSYGTTQWSDLPDTICRLRQLGERLCHEGYRIQAIARKLLKAEQAALAARRDYVGLGQAPIEMPCTCALRREMEHYGELMWLSGCDDLQRADRLTSELGIAMPALDELRKLGVIMPVPFDKPFNR